MTQLNTELFQVHSPNAPSSAGAQVEFDEEEEFCRAFQEEVTIGMFLFTIISLSHCPQDESTEGAHTESTTGPILPPSVSVPTHVEPSTPPPNLDVPSTLLPTNTDDPYAAPNSEDESAGRPTAAKKKSSKRKGKDGTAVPVNMRRTTRNAGGGTKKAAGVKTSKA